MRQHIVDVFHHHVDVKVQHPVDRVRVGIDQVAADINTGIGVQDVELACLLQDLRHQRRAALRVKQIDDQRNHRVAVLFAECR